MGSTKPMSGVLEQHHPIMDKLGDPSGQTYTHTHIFQRKGFFKIIFSISSNFPIFSFEFICHWQKFRIMFVILFSFHITMFSSLSGKLSPILSKKYTWPYFNFKIVSLCLISPIYIISEPFKSSWLLWVSLCIEFALSFDN